MAERQRKVPVARVTERLVRARPERHWWVGGALLVPVGFAIYFFYGQVRPGDLSTGKVAVLLALLTGLLGSRGMKLPVQVGWGLVLTAMFFMEWRSIEGTRLAEMIVPAKEVTPPNGCSGRDGGGFVLMAGGKATVVSSFPHTIVASRSQGPLVRLERADDGSIYPVIEIRDESRHTVLRVDRSGYQVGAPFSMVRPDASTIDVMNELGDRELSVHFYNEHALAIDGYLDLRGRRIEMQLPRMSGNCIMGTRVGDIVVP